MNFAEIIFNIVGGIAILALCAWLIDEPYYG